jgi:hypothetical protein
VPVLPIPLAVLMNLAGLKRFSYPVALEHMPHLTGYLTLQLRSWRAISEVDGLTRYSDVPGGAIEVDAASLDGLLNCWIRYATARLDV